MPKHILGGIMARKKTIKKKNQKNLFPKNPSEKKEKQTRPNRNQNNEKGS